MSVLSEVPEAAFEVGYFAYGIEVDPKVINTVVGRKLEIGLGVSAVGVRLAIQKIEHIPDVPSIELGQRSAQEILRTAWYPESFSSHVLVPEADDTPAGPGVEGVLFPIIPSDATELTEWNLANPELGAAAWKSWITVKLGNGATAAALTITPGQKLDRIIHGHGYDPLLNGREATMRVARSFAEGRRAA